MELPTSSTHRGRNSTTHRGRGRGRASNRGGSNYFNNQNQDGSNSERPFRGGQQSRSANRGYRGRRGYFVGANGFEKSKKIKSDNFKTFLACNLSEKVHFKTYKGPSNEYDARSKDKNELKIPIFKHQPFTNFEETLSTTLKEHFIKYAFEDTELENFGSKKELEDCPEPSIDIYIRFGLCYFRNTWFCFDGDFTVEELISVMDDKPGFTFDKARYYREPTAYETESGIFERFGHCPLMSSFHAVQSCQVNDALKDALYLHNFDLDAAKKSRVINVNIDIKVNENKQGTSNLLLLDLILTFDCESLVLLEVKLRRKDCNLNVITGKGVNYSGDFTDIFDIRFQGQSTSKLNGNELLQTLGYTENDFTGLLQWKSDENSNILILNPRALKDDHFIKSIREAHRWDIPKDSDADFDQEFPACEAVISNFKFYHLKDKQKGSEFRNIGADYNELEVAKSVDSVLHARIQNVKASLFHGNKALDFAKYLWHYADILGQCALIAAEK